jgi:hypothetical protein
MPSAQYVPSTYQLDEGKPVIRFGPFLCAVSALHTHFLQVRFSMHYVAY